VPTCNELIWIWSSGLFISVSPVLSHPAKRRN